MPNTNNNTFSGLYERGLMTPTYLSSLVMLAVLQAQLMYKDSKPLVLTGELNQNSWATRSRPDIDRCQITQNQLQASFQLMATTHKFHTSSVGQLETLIASQKNKSNQEYEVYFCGNGQDAMSFTSAYSRINTDPNKNYIFWNYPGVGASAGSSRSVHDLIEAGYQQVKRLLDQNIPPENITLHGFSLGGGVATQVARRLHEEDYNVNLDVQCSFAQIARFIPAQLETDKSDTPLLTSMIALGVSGFALGAALAGLVASIGVVLATLTTPTIKPYIEGAFNVVGSLAGGILAVAGYIVGALAGLALGVLLSVQYLWTDRPLTVPMTPAFSAALHATCCEMDSVDAIHRMLAGDNTPNISVTNIADDRVIVPAASLNAGLGFKHNEAPRDDETRALKQKITSFWYQYGGHGGTPEVLIDTAQMPCPN